MIRKPNYNLRLVSSSVELRPITSKELYSHEYKSWLKDEETTKYLKFDASKMDDFDPALYVNENREKGFENFAIFYRGNFSGTLNYNFKSDSDSSAAYGIMIGDKKALLAGVGLHATALIIMFLMKVVGVQDIGPEKTNRNNKNALSILKYFGFKIEEESVDDLYLIHKNITTETINKYNSEFKENIFYESIKTID